MRYLRSAAVTTAVTDVPSSCALRTAARHTSSGMRSSFLRAKASGDLVSAGRDDIAIALGISSTTASRAYRILIRDGWVTVCRKGSGPGYPTMYRITPGGVA